MSFRRGYLGDRRSPSCVYVGSLPDDVRERELEDLFLKFGRIVDIDIKKGRTSNGTAYAFVEFEHVKDAMQAVDRRHGYIFGNHRLRVERTGERKIRKREPFGAPPQRTDYRVVVSHLPDGCRWQHLKDHMRRAGDVGYANIEGGRGIVEYMRYDDMMYALDKLDATEMLGPYGAPSVIKVREDEGYGGGRGGREGADGYARRKFRSRSIEKDYRRRMSGSVPHEEKLLKRRSPSETGRYANHSDYHNDKYKYRKSYSGSNSRSRSIGGRGAGRRSVSRSRDRSRSGLNDRKSYTAGDHGYLADEQQHAKNNINKRSISKSASRGRSYHSNRSNNNRDRSISNNSVNKEKAIECNNSNNNSKMNGAKSRDHSPLGNNCNTRMDKSISRSNSISPSVNRSNNFDIKHKLRKNSGNDEYENDYQDVEASTDKNDIPLNGSLIAD